MSLLILIPFAYLLFTRLTQYSLAVFLCSFLLLALTTALVLTYSRGGWLSYFGGLAFLFFADRRLKKSVLLCGIMFSVIILLIPRGPDRAREIFDQSDLSISNRIEVWKGALKMTADYPGSGIGAGNFGPYFSAWYQPLFMKTRYATALNNYMTISCEYGIPALVLYLTMLFLPIYASAVLSIKNAFLFPLGLNASLIAFSISSVFTCNLHSLIVTLLCASVWALLFLHYLTAIYSRQIAGFHSFLKILYITSGTSIGLWATGLVLNYTTPVNVKLFPFRSGTQALAAVVLTPNGCLNKGIVVYFHDTFESLEDSSQTILRPLAQEGYTVYSFDNTTSLKPAMIESRLFMLWCASNSHSVDQHIFLCGKGDGGRLALLTECQQHISQVRSVCVINADLDWPFEDLSPIHQISNLRVPLLLMYTYNTSNLRNSVSKFTHRAANYNKTVYVGYQIEDLQPTALINQLDAFFHGS